MRGIDPEERTPEDWRDLFMQAASEWPTAADAMRRYATRWPGRRCSAGLPGAAGNRRRSATPAARRNMTSARREYAWEIMRAFARAAHVLLGHLDAYANEGYLRTATQWDNVRKLAAMVNYQPAPAASAISDRRA